MLHRMTFTRSAVVACILLLAFQASALFAGSANTKTELTPEMIVAEHVKSIGGPSLLASVHTRALVGFTDVNFITGMSGNIENGNAMLASTGDKLSMVLKRQTGQGDE